MNSEVCVSHVEKFWQTGRSWKSSSDLFRLKDCWERLGFSAFRWRSQPTRSKMKIDRHICGMLRRQWGPAVIQPGTLTACLKALWAVWIRPWIERFWLRLKLLYYIKKKQQNPQFLQYGTSSMLELSTFTVQATRELPSPCAASACRSSEHQRECGCC